MKKYYSLIIFCFLGITTQLVAQQLPLSNQYLADPYALSPAYSGLSGGFEAFLSYKKDRINQDYTPETILFDMNTPLSEYVGVGFNLMNDKTDIFSNTHVNANYTYHVKLTDNHFLDMTVFGGIIHKKIDLNGILVQDYTDPLIFEKDEIKETSVNAGAGLMYRWKKLNVGFVAPYLFQSKETVYDYKQHYVGYLSYDFKLSTDWNLLPYVVARGGENVPWDFDVTALGKYKEKYWVGLTYRKNNIGALNIGGYVTENILVHYTYNMSLPYDEYKGVTGKDWGSHEITIGFRLGKKGSKADQILEAVKQRSRIGQVDSLGILTKKLQDQLKKLNDSIVELNEERTREIKKQNEKLLDQSGEMKDDLNELNSKVTNLQGTIDKVSSAKESKFRVLRTGESVRDGYSSVAKGYYVVIGSFRSEENANRAVKIYETNEIKPFIIHNTVRKWYYVYSDKYDDLQTALQKMRQLREGRHDDAWVHIYR